MAQTTLTFPLQPSDDDIVIEGYLSKQGGSKGGFQNWKKRWVVIERSTVCLKYFHSEVKDPVLGVVPLKNAEVFDVLSEAAQRGSINPLMIQKMIDNESKSAKRESVFTQGRVSVSSLNTGFNSPTSQTKCTICNLEFVLLIRPKYGCSNCFQEVCGSCSTKKTPLPHLGMMEPVRVCDTCISTLKLPKWNMNYESNCKLCRSDFTLTNRRHQYIILLPMSFMQL